jgi:hypothetical protein
MKPRVRLTTTEPIKVLADCKRAALKANWLLSEWVEFSATCRACLTADCEPEEMALFMSVVRERFDVQS